MQLNRIVAAADESDAGREAIRTALEIGRRSSAKVMLLHVVTAPAIAALPPASDHDRSLSVDEEGERQLVPGHEAQDELSIAYGVPGIEICRFAEDKAADLIVLGRKKHCERSRLLLGDTADAVARRSRISTLFVPASGTQLRRILVALDGSPRGMSVLQQACDFAQLSGASVQVITVDRFPLLRPIAAESPSITRGQSLQRFITECLERRGLPDTALITRDGDVAEEVLDEIAKSGCDVLVIGRHRGGQPWAVQPGSVAQRLSHEAPCAVLSVPL